MPLTVSCSGVVPQRMDAAGVSGFLPSAISFLLMLGRFFTPMRKTTVPMPARERQLMVDSGLVGSSWPVTNATSVEQRRSVTGMPA